ncbi:hypothetical protein K7432_001021 [Basidiobolus ranarum]|uniref:3'-5' exonuclease n=1 Tax=Basidiobolus ranarum TaxID=34480 RepID=A0ABR2WA93_9FUNG
MGCIFSISNTCMVSAFRHSFRSLRICMVKHAYVIEFPIRLRELLEDPYILKPGCNIRGDGTRLFKDFGVESKSLLELGSLGIQVSNEFNGRKIQKLTTLVEILLQRSMKKDRNIALSNWEAYKLSADQINYAGNDAYVGYKLFERIREIQLEKQNEKFWLTLCNVDNDTKVHEVERTLEKQLIICNNPQKYPIISITNTRWNTPVASVGRPTSNEPEVNLHTSLSDLQNAYFKHEKMSKTSKFELSISEDFSNQFGQEVMDPWRETEKSNVFNHSEGTLSSPSAKKRMLNQGSQGIQPSSAQFSRTSPLNDELSIKLVSLPSEPVMTEMDQHSRHTQIFQESLNYSESWEEKEAHSAGDSTEADHLVQDYLSSLSNRD